MEKTYVSIQTSLTVTVIVGLFFIGLGYFNSKKITNNKNYICGEMSDYMEELGIIMEEVIYKVQVI